jgi:hypothetical protein
MGLTGATDLLDLRAMDTAEDVIVRFIDHDMHYPQGRGSKNSRKLLPRSEWRFMAEFSDGSTKWMLWPEANKMAALDEYAAQCKLKLPPRVRFFRMIFFHSCRRVCDRETQEL